MLLNLLQLNIGGVVIKFGTFGIAMPRMRYANVLEEEMHLFLMVDVQ